MGATCPGDTKVVAGGFSGEADNFIGIGVQAFEMTRPKANHIRVWGGSHTIYGSQLLGGLSAYAYCRQGRGAASAHLIGVRGGDLVRGVPQ